MADHTKNMEVLVSFLVFSVVVCVHGRQHKSCVGNLLVWSLLRLAPITLLTTFLTPTVYMVFSFLMTLLKIIDYPSLVIFKYVLECFSLYMCGWHLQLSGFHSETYYKNMTKLSWFFVTKLPK